MLRQTISSLLFRSAEVFEVHSPQITEQIDHRAAVGVMEVVPGLVEHTIVCGISMAVHNENPAKMLLTELICDVHEDFAQSRRQHSTASWEGILVANLVRGTGA